MNLALSQTPVMRAAVLVRRPAGEVFRAFTDPAVTTRFWFTDSTGPLAPGAEVTWRWSMFDVEVPVRVVEFEPPRRLVIAWRNEGGPLTRVEWTFTDQESGTRVEVVESGYTGSGDDVVARLADSTAGFTQVLVAAKALLEHDVVVDVMGDRGAKPELPRPDLAERPHQSS